MKDKPLAVQVYSVMNGRIGDCKIVQADFETFHLQEIVEPFISHLAILFWDYRLAQTPDLTGAQL